MLLLLSFSEVFLSRSGPHCGRNTLPKKGLRYWLHFPLDMLRFCTPVHQIVLCCSLYFFLRPHSLFEACAHAFKNAYEVFVWHLAHVLSCCASVKEYVTLSSYRSITVLCWCSLDFRGQIFFGFFPQFLLLPAENQSVFTLFNFVFQSISVRSQLLICCLRQKNLPHLIVESQKNQNPNQLVLKQYIIHAAPLLCLHIHSNLSFVFL